jgi:hypothetical protein
MARMRRLLLATLAVAGALTGCSGEPPRPVSVFSSPSPSGDSLAPLSGREESSPGTATATPDPDDPAEPGISDLARLARYVFRVMGQHEEICPFDNPFRDRLHFALEVQVRAGRMTRVDVGNAGIETGAEVRSLDRSQWPRELVDYVACIAPHLESVAMNPSPADGTYEPVYTFSGRASGRPGP